MSNILIVGATRGIGLELTKQYAEEGNSVIACARDKSNASLLDELASGSENISIEELDIANPSSIESAANNIGVGFDVFIGFQSACQDCGNSCKTYYKKISCRKRQLRFSCLIS
jgi:short-subunit dehydrogenase